MPRRGRVVSFTRYPPRARALIRMLVASHAKYIVSQVQLPVRNLLEELFYGMITRRSGPPIVRQKRVIPDFLNGDTGMDKTIFLTFEE